MAHGAGYTVLLTGKEAVLSLQGPEPIEESERLLQKMDAPTQKRFESRKFYMLSPRFHPAKKADVVRIAMNGAKPSAKVQALDPLPGKANYFIGNDPEKWRTGIPTYGQVKYVGIYPGIDLVYYGKQGQLEFDFVVAPGVDPNAIQLRLDGPGRLSTAKDGGISIRIADRSLELRPPSVYQMKDGKRIAITGRFIRRDGKSFGFQVSKYDSREPLVIDPSLSYSTYLGGTGKDYASGIAVDSQGNTYMAGQTTSTDFPTYNGYSASGSSSGVVFVTRLNPTGTAVLYSTYLGGTGGDWGGALALDSSNNVYIAGTALSSDFPVVNGFQTSLASPYGNVFVARIDTTQTGTASLVFSTYLGGGGNSANSLGDVGLGIAVDSGGFAYVTGQTASSNFPTTSTAFQTVLGGGNGNAFLSVLNTTQGGANSLVYSTYLGGVSQGFGDYGVGVAADGTGNAYLTGQTTSSGFPTTSTAYQATLNSNYGNAFVSVIQTTQSGAQSLLYSTYLGGSSTIIVGDLGSGIALDPSDKIYVGGDTTSSDFPVTSGAYQTTNSPGGRGFVAKFDSSQSGSQSLVYSTYLGGTNGGQGEVINGLAVDNNGNAFAAGSTSSSDFPTTADALQTTLKNPSWDAFLSELNPTGANLVYSTYFGGSCANGDLGNGVAIDLVGNPYLAGSTCSTDLSVYPSNAYQTSLRGVYNGFVAKVVLATFSVTPSNPTLAANSSQQFTATATYPDGSQRDLTASVAWTSSNSSSAVVSNYSPTQGFAVAIAAGTSTITASLAGLSASTTLTVTSYTAPAPPAISSASPTSGTVGTQVTVLGSGFGASQGTGAVWIGSIPGAVTSWSDTQIVANVVSGSTSGVIQVQQGGQLSNTLSFTMTTATITSVSPTSGVAGTSVIIAGTGFGSTQGTGEVQLGSTAGIVTSWSDTQITATVAPAAGTGVAQVLQNGAWSNSTPFEINTPQITSVSPNPASSGALITITGSGFGSSQEGGTVWLGSAFGSVTNWSDTQITANLDPAALSGIARVQQNGVSSNSVSLTVSVSGGGTQLTLTPDVITMAAGDTHNIKALNPQGQLVTGLTWTSSDTTIITLSTDDPPVITAVAAGHATISAGNASADVTVMTGPLPTGTIQWSNSGDGSGVSRVVPAVPSTAGTDVFAFQNSGNVSAIDIDGTTLWTATPNGTAVPDFLGGLVVWNSQSVQELSPGTGQANPAYSFANSPINSSLLSLGVDGTIYTVDNNSLVAIKPTTGTLSFSVPLNQGKNVFLNEGCPLSPPSSQNPVPPALYQTILAGDGNVYVLYSFENFNTVEADCLGDDSYSSDLHLRLLQEAPDGSSSATIDLGDWNNRTSSARGPGDQFSEQLIGFQSGTLPALSPSMLTNSNTGVLVSLGANFGSYCGYTSQWVPRPPNGVSDIYEGCVAATTTYQLAATSGSSVASDVTLGAGIAAPLNPVLELQDGSFVGTVGLGPSPGNVTESETVAFDQFGNISLTLPNISPQIATADDGFVGTSPDGLLAETFDRNGNATGQIPSLLTQSWRGNLYQTGSTEQVTAVPIAFATPPFSSFRGGNQSGNLTGGLCYDDRDKLVSEYGSQYVGDSYYVSLGKPYPWFLPTCYQFSNSPHSQYFTFSEINEPSPSLGTPEFSYALVKKPLVVSASSGYGLDLWRQTYGAPRIINSGYRDPVQNGQAGGTNDSRHMLGDAVDLKNESGTPNEWNAMVNAAGNSQTHVGAEADFVEPQSGPCSLGCVHADWRYHDHTSYAH